MTTLTVFGMSGAGTIICLVWRCRSKRAWANGGQKYRAYLRKHKRRVYNAFQSDGTLDEHFAEIDQRIERFDLLLILISD